MSFSRVSVLGRALLSRGSPAPIAHSIIRYSKVRTIVPQRQFTAINGLLQKSAQEGISQAPSSTPALDIPEAQRLKNARSIVILHLPKTMGGPKLKAVLKDCGIEMYVPPLQREYYPSLSSAPELLQVVNVTKTETDHELHIGMSCRSYSIDSRSTTHALPLLN